MIRYQEALNRCLEAIAAGDDLESILAGLPARHRERLRRDATLSAALRRHAATQPVPTAAAEINALSRLNAELNSVRAARAAAASRGGFFGVPRFALAGLLLAALLLGASFLIDPSRGGDGTVEAAEFEGVVIASGDGSLTVQTLDTLEEIMVPLSAQVLDENGIKLELAALAAGEVVSVRGSREQGGPVHALDVRRLLNGLPGWCNENPERCRQIAQNLTEAQERCQRDPEVCRLLHDRVTDLVTRVTDVADLEDLKRRCRGEPAEGSAKTSSPSAASTPSRVRAISRRDRSPTDWKPFATGCNSSGSAATTATRRPAASSRRFAPNTPASAPTRHCRPKRH